ncbi:hypothetical protein Syun_006519 [Stephania yunnanensis]|uniref:Uncharacterized protein n=1 Tax=Stephania yunnanensis TaxID=152371 RepID=A0AAP0PXM8_9MAGN
MQHMIMMCSAKNEKITPVPICIQTLTTSVTTKMLKAAMFAMLSDSLLLPREGAMKPMHMQVSCACELS